MNKVRILVVDDEPKLVRLLREVFTATGFDVLVSHHAEHAIEQVALEQPDVVILDIMFPGPTSGFEVCRRIREFSDVPVIMLTAKVRDTDKLRGFEVGADDYITKPFNSKELVARVRAVLKRAQSSSSVEKSAAIECGRLVIDLICRRVTVDGKEVHLTPIEYNLLCVLAQHHDQVLMHEQLLANVWGQDHRSDADYLRAFIYNLRKKIEADPSNPTLIVRYPGIGYSLVSPSVKSKNN
jgi:two-component system, OmpR family, KDP operon response regulator KdpE